MKQKNLFKGFLAITMLLCTTHTWAYDFSAVNDEGVTIYYNILSEDDLTCEVTGRYYISSSNSNAYTGNVDIPENTTYLGKTYSVVAIGDYAFYKCTSLETATIGNSVTSIGYEAFYGCTSLEAVTIPNSVTSIGDKAFYNCSSITEVSIPNSVTSIGSYAFYSCSSLTEVTIPNSVTSIGSYAFYSCSSLTEVTIPNSVTSIGSYAFENCTSLETATIGNSVTSIGYAAFYGCTSLEAVTIPNSVTSIGGHAFSSCSSLEEVRISNSLTSIEDYTFYDCTSLSEVTIPNSVTSIGSYAFNKCTSLTDVTIGNSVTSIGSYAFENCTSLEAVTIPNSVTSIGSDAFQYCTSLTKVTISNSVTSIESCSFRGCTSLAFLIIEDGDETLTMSTSATYTPFTQCPIETLYLGRNLSFNSSSTSVPSVFNNSTLTTLTIGEQVTNIPQSIFSSCAGLTGELKIPDSVTTIGSSAFYNCSGLTSVTIGENVTSIGNYAFSQCEGLTEVTLNAITCTSVGSQSSPIFNNCSNINKLIIGENVTTIPAYMFYGCTSLTDLVSYSILPPIYKSTTFESSILKAEVPKESIIKYVVDDKWKKIPTIYSIDDGNIYYPVPILCEGDAIVVASGGDEDGVALPEGAIATISSIAGGQVRGIVQYGVDDVTETINGSGEYSFTVSQYHKINTVYSYAMTTDNMYDLTVAQGGDVLNQISVSKINDVYYLKVRGDINGDDVSTIRRMPNLMVLNLSDANIVSGGGAYYDTNTTEDNVVGSYFFTDLSNLRYVSLPNNVTSIEQYAFKNCDGLIAMAIPSKVATIGGWAFSGCTNLITLFFYEGGGQLNITVSSNSSSNPFSNCPLVSAYVDRKLSYSYYGVGTQYNSPFANKSTLVSVILGDHISEIGNSEFSGCSGLTEVTIPESITEIDDSAFYGCTGLTALTIPESVTSIGNSAFSGCTGLTTLLLEDSEETLTMATSNSISPFSNCPIETLYLGRNVSSSVFRNNPSLTSLTISNNVTSIVGSTFLNCTGLTEVTIPNSVTSIGNSAFSGCTGLTEVTIGEGVSSIGSSAFQNCSGLETINSANPTPPDITSSTFSGVDKESCVLNIPIGSLNAYWVHVYWGEFFNIKEVDFPDGINNIVHNNLGGDIIGYYTLDGKKMPSVQHGINIIRYSDGTTRKVLVK